MGIAPSTHSFMNRQHPSNCLTRIESVWSDQLTWWLSTGCDGFCHCCNGRLHHCVFRVKQPLAVDAWSWEPFIIKSHILEATPRPICLFLMPLSRRRICSQAKRESSGKRPIQPMGSYGAQGHWCEFGVPKFLGKTELLGIWSGARDSANLQNSTKKWLWAMSYDGVSYKRGLLSHLGVTSKIILAHWF